LKTDLPDINLWIALIDENHSKHRIAAHYWTSSRQAVIAFCRVTMLGLFRVATNSSTMSGNPFTFQEMWSIYDRFVEMPDVTILPEPDIDGQLRNTTKADGFRQSGWTDAYLATFANASGSRLVTFDNDFRTFQGLDLLLL
jgi:toxin-antitoxin system PIN domain toxin